MKKLLLLVAGLLSGCAPPATEEATKEAAKEDTEKEGEVNDLSDVLTIDEMVGGRFWQSKFIAGIYEGKGKTKVHGLPGSGSSVKLVWRKDGVVELNGLTGRFSRFGNTKDEHVLTGPELETLYFRKEKSGNLTLIAREKALPEQERKQRVDFLKDDWLLLKRVPVADVREFLSTLDTNASKLPDFTKLKPVDANDEKEAPLSFDFSNLTNAPAAPDFSQFFKTNREIREAIEKQKKGGLDFSKPIFGEGIITNAPPAKEEKLGGKIELLPSKPKK